MCCNLFIDLEEACHIWAVCTSVCATVLNGHAGCHAHAWLPCTRLVAMHKTCRASHLRQVGGQQVVLPYSSCPFEVRQPPHHFLAWENCGVVQLTRVGGQQVALTHSLCSFEVSHPPHHLVIVYTLQGLLSLSLWCFDVSRKPCH